MSCGRSQTEIQADIAAIKRAIGRGVSSYSYDGRNVVYRNMDEMKEALGSLERELSESGGDARQPRAFAAFGRGYR